MHVKIIQRGRMLNEELMHWELFHKYVPKYSVRLLMTWLPTQAVTVWWGAAQTTSLKVTNGVRQGGIPSPKAYAIYVDQLSEQLESSKVECHINMQCMNMLPYAGDAVLLVPIVDALQKLTDVWQEFARQGDMVYHFKMSEYTAFIPYILGHIHTPNAYLGDKKLKWVDQKWFLGLLIWLDCSDIEDIARQNQKIYGSSNMLTTYFRRCGKEVKLKLFKTYCHNMYGTHLWSEYSKTGYDRIRIAFNNILHNLLGLKRRDSSLYECQHGQL